MVEPSERSATRRKAGAVTRVLAAVSFCGLVTAVLLASKLAFAGTPWRPVQEAAAPEGANTANDSWAPELLYDIISSPNPAALESLYDAVFTTGPSMVPQLVAALKDDRTAEFGAQSLAFIGGEDAFKALSTLVNDPRNLNLRRYYYGALAEIDTPQAADYLVGVIRNANREPDRTVTEAAIIALTVRSDARLIPRLKQVETKLSDPVISDDLENAISVIQTRSQYLAAHPSTGGALRDALNLYFQPALAESGAIPPGKPGQAPAAAPHRGSSLPASANIGIEHIAFSPSQNRALARVLFRAEGEQERFWVVLQKRYGDWTVASVWLRMEEASAPPPTGSTHPGAPLHPKQSSR